MTPLYLLATLSFTQNSLEAFRVSLTEADCMFSVDVILKMDDILLEPSEVVVQSIVLNTINSCLNGLKRVIRWKYGTCTGSSSDQENRSFYADVMTVIFQFSSGMCSKFN